MSTPSQPAGQGQSAQQTAQQGQPAQQAAQQTAQQTAQQGQNAQPARQGQTVSTPSRSSWNTPRLLRLARAGAAGAVLLTGVAATGTFSTDGLNATPAVVAQQWVAAERAGVEMAQADLRAAERLTGGDQESTRDAFDDAVTQVGTDLTSMGVDTLGAAEIAREWSTFVLETERAVATTAQSAPTDEAAAEDGEGDGEPSVSAAYGEASYAVQTATAATDMFAEQHAQDLRTGSRSFLTGTVGTLSTIGLVAIMFWLALRTRRIINVPLLVATLITAGLTYLSFNPSALPITYDQRLGATTTAATALQEVYQARQSQHLLALGGSDRWPDESVQAREAIEELDVPTLVEAWDDLLVAHEEAATDGSLDREAAAQLLGSSQETFQTVEDGLRDRLDDRLSAAAAEVGFPAGLTSGVAFLLGLIGAGFAWTGLSRRLKDYR